MVDIFNKLIQNELSPNQFYILWCKKNNLCPLFSLALNLEYIRLEHDNWLDENRELTPKSIAFIQEIDSYFKVSKKKTSPDILGENFQDKIAEYLEIFPKFKLPSGKYARSDKKNLENNFRWFFEDHSYDWNTVLEATKMYVDEFERSGYKYMRTSQYFIRKLNPAEKTFESELANYCEVYLNGDVDTTQGYFSEKVV